MAFRTWFISFIVTILFFLNFTKLVSQDLADSTLYLEGVTAEKSQEISTDGFGLFRSKASISDFNQIKNQFYINLYSHIKFFHQDILFSDKEIKSLNSIRINLGNFSAGYGRGEVHIGKGFLIGNQFMRFTANPSQNFRLSNFKVRTKNYDYYKELKHFSYSSEKMRLSLADYNNVYIVSGEYLRKKDIYGIAMYYETENPYFEYWIQLEKGLSKFNFNFSHSLTEFNHLNFGMFQQFDKLKFNSSITKLSRNYKYFDNDTKWGSYFDSEGVGFINGIEYTHSSFLRFRSTYLYAKENECLSKKFINDVRLRFGKIHFVVSYQMKNQNTLEASERFPYLLSYTNEIEDIIKIRLDYKYSKQLNLQWSNYYSPSDIFSFVTYFRIKYKSNNYHFLTQYSYGEKSETTIYFTRPLYYPYYLIQRLSGNISYFDFNFGYHIGSAVINLLYKTDFSENQISCQIQIDLKK
ncbi:MAG: hypothetical protein U9N76_06845 [Candidatus Marinimicrobia bacterium]|nr:hypothetical protein [Candidatus Neomarinimicrobiota bacterium]